VDKNAGSAASHTIVVKAISEQVHEVEVALLGGVLC
jgi:hypothetical protein